jgi:hypothetical protein
MNSPESVREATELAQQLLAKTLEKKLKWSTKFLEQATFETKLTFEFQFTVSFLDGIYSLTMRDRLDAEILSVSVENEPQFGYTIAGESQLVDALKQLYEKARRDALGVGEKIDRAREFLENL